MSFFVSQDRATASFLKPTFLKLFRSPDSTSLVKKYCLSPQIYLNSRGLIFSVGLLLASVFFTVSTFSSFWVCMSWRFWELKHIYPATVLNPVTGINSDRDHMVMSLSTSRKAKISIPPFWLLITRLIQFFILVQCNPVCTVVCCRAAQSQHTVHHSTWIESPNNTLWCEIEHSFWFYVASKSSQQWWRQNDKLREICQQLSERNNGRRSSSSSCRIYDYLNVEYVQQWYLAFKISPRHSPQGNAKLSKAGNGEWWKWPSP